MGGFAHVAPGSAFGRLVRRPHPRRPELGTRTVGHRPSGSIPSDRYDWQSGESGKCLHKKAIDVTDRSVIRTTTFSRRLRAVALVDVADYSLLMSSHESETHERVNRLFSSEVVPIVGAHSGQAVERVGDGLLLIFESSTDALRCALAIQQAVTQSENPLPATKRLRLRIGINVGDIIIDGEEIAGDDVNIAARLQALAVPGGICFSQAVRDQIHEDLGVGIADMGPQALKNIGRAVRVYQILPAALGKVGRVRLRWRSTGRLTAYAIALAGLLLGMAWLRQEKALEAGASAAPPMSVAVLPIVARGNVTSDTLHELTQQIARGMALTRWITTTVADTGAESASSAHELRSLGARLGVRYLVVGVMDAGVGRMDFELVDSNTGTSGWRWMASLSGERSPAAAIQELSVPLREAIYGAERQRLVDSGGKARTPMEHKMLGDMATDTEFVTVESERRARAHYEDALRIDPAFVPALVSIGYTLIAELDLDLQPERAELLQQLDHVSQRALSRDTTSAPAWQLRAEALARLWRWEAALDASEKAIALDSARSFAFSQRAALMLRLGRLDEALTLVDRALSLAEQRPGFALLQRCRALMGKGDYRGAVAACQKSVAREELWLQHAYLLAAYTLLDDHANAHLARATLQRMQPRLTLRFVRGLQESNHEIFRQQSEQHLLRGLRQAGIPEGN